MSETYSVPKHRLAARLTLVGSPAEPVQLFLAECAENHVGPERPSDLLNGPGRFFPVLQEDGTFSFVPRDAVIVLSVPSESEVADGLPAEDLAAQLATTVGVHLRLEDGTRLDGTLVYLMPAAQQRLQDYLNHAEDRFIPLRDGDTTHLVNRDRIVRITPAR